MTATFVCINKWPIDNVILRMIKVGCKLVNNAAQLLEESFSHQKKTTFVGEQGRKKKRKILLRRKVVFGVMTGEAAEAGTRSLGAGDTCTQERVKSLRWREKKRNSIKGGGHERLEKKKIKLVCYITETLWHRVNQSCSFSRCC